jgi:hypothetical protein
MFLDIGAIKNQNKKMHGRSNAILGRTDVVDPTTRTKYNVSITPNGNYHWIDGLGNIVATQRDSAPGIHFRKMAELP